MLILINFVLQAVSYEYQKKPGNTLGRDAFRTFLILNGVLGPLLLGMAVATFFTGSPFVVEHSAMMVQGLRLSSAAGQAVGMDLKQWPIP